MSKSSLMPILCRTIDLIDARETVNHRNLRNFGLVNGMCAVFILGTHALTVLWLASFACLLVFAPGL